MEYSNSDPFLSVCWETKQKEEKNIKMFDLDFSRAYT